MNGADPAMLEVMKNAFFSVTEEMGIALVRTAYSTNIKDRKDCSCALYTPDGRLIAQGLHIPGHLGAMVSTIKGALAAIPPDSLRPGDAILYNDPYIGNTHTPDMVLTTPVFHRGRLMAFVASMAHHIDVGGSVPGSLSARATEVFHEGLRLPPVMAMRDGEFDSTILTIVQANSRTPDEVRGDLKAQAGANRIGARRFLDLCERHGADVVQDAIDELEAYCERRMRAELGDIPQGTFEFEDYLESDGFTDDPIKLKVAIHTKGDRLVFDWTGTATQVRGPVNGQKALILGCVHYVVKSITDATIPPNEGTYRPIELITPPGTVVNATFPAPTGMGGNVLGPRVVDTILGALSKCIPERVCAAAVGGQNFLSLGGRDPATGHYFSNVETYGGGYGASIGQDGEDAIQTHRTNSKNCPCEVIEATFPMLVDRYGIVPDSEGPGRFRGGMGVTREYTFNSAAAFTFATDRAVLEPWGLDGGKSPGKGVYRVVHADGSAEDVGGKCQREVEAGARFVLRTRGGGGWGDPFRRDPEKIRWDVLEGLLSVERARNVYGVVIDPAFMAVDGAGTAELRAQPAHSAAD
ncbi:MAG: hydantoinase B/oxoprolinase family protein [Rhodospirillales bacterium]|nr:hydantoinase B/oxoprolinase family protein [Rhodospirillales bacterium]MDP6883309.1 hydantoinase B/oxoprolinase family protein [Rhodospirillales bacterium]